VSLRSILQQVSSETGVPVAAIVGPAQTKDIYEARHRYCWEARQVTRDDGKPRYSWRQIADVLGRDHTTAINSAARWQERLDGVGVLPPMSDRERAVLNAITDIVGVNALGPVSQVKLCDRLRLCRHFVMKDVALLERRGLIERHNRLGKPALIRVAAPEQVAA